MHVGHGHVEEEGLLSSRLLADEPAAQQDRTGHVIHNWWNMKSRLYDLQTDSYTHLSA